VAVGFYLAVSASLTECQSLRGLKAQAWEEQMKLQTEVQVLRPECGSVSLSFPLHTVARTFLKI